MYRCTGGCSPLSHNYFLSRCLRIGYAWYTRSQSQPLFYISNAWFLSRHGHSTVTTIRYTLCQRLSTLCAGLGDTGLPAAVLVRMAFPPPASGMTFSGTFHDGKAWMFHQHVPRSSPLSDMPSKGVPQGGCEVSGSARTIAPCGFPPCSA